MRRTGFLFANLFVSLLFASCQKAPPCSTADIADYFINPTSNKRARLAKCRLDTAVFNAGVRELRAKTVPGMFSKRLIDSLGLPYYLGYLTPETIKSDTLYPLIIYLHGGIGTERVDKGDSAFFMLAALADTFDLFLASPSANRYAPWWSPLGLTRILQSIRFMTLHYRINPEKIFLAGVSDGATGCYAAANTIPAPFAGFIAVSGFGGMLPDLGMPLYAENLMHRPIYTVNAGHDRLYPIERVEQFITALQERGIPLTSKVYPDEQHGFDYRDKEMGALANFIRTWSRPSDTQVAWTPVAGFPNLPPVKQHFPEKASTPELLEYMVKSGFPVIHVSGRSIERPDTH